MFRQIFRPRDLFFHDGSSLRRFHVSTRLQLGLVAAIAFVALGFAILAGRALTPTPAELTNANVAAMQSKVAALEADYAVAKREASAHAARLEQRQAFLAALMAGETDRAKLAALLPSESGDLHSAGARAIVAPFGSIDKKQNAMLALAVEETRDRYQSTAAMLRKLGLDPRRFHRAQGGMGGPYEPVDAKSGDSDPQYQALFMSWKKLDQLQQGVISVPSLRPIKDISFTSGFGVRSDPFRGTAAMHAGVDMPGPVGTPIYATADGVVGRAQWANGYGNLVELEHGKGIQTRYGHLSQILVRAGQRVRRGDLIAKMGSTGRSTGPHLHYEVRLDGRAVNPTPFLQSSDYLMAMQRRAETTQVALGGPDN